MGFFLIITIPFPLLVVFHLVFSSNDYQISLENQLSIPQHVRDILLLLASKNTCLKLLFSTENSLVFLN